MAIIIIPLTLLKISSANDDGTNSLQNLDILSAKKEKLADTILFSYGIQFLGPSLSSSYQDGATYNRFNSGQDYKGDNTDATGSYQFYHSLSLGYKISKNWSFSYSYTFQDELNKNIDYETYNADGSVFRTNQRKGGLSYNNQRMNFFSNGLYSNNHFFLMSNFFYELPTTEISKDSHMKYGIGIQPVVGIYSSIPHLYHGLKASIQRDYYQRQDFEYQCGPYTCSTRYQTLFANISGYLGYYISDKLSIHSEVIFDWDQKGNEAGTNKFNQNMDDVIEVGPKYRLNENINLSGKLQYSLNKLNNKHSAFLFNFNLFI